MVGLEQQGRMKSSERLLLHCGETNGAQRQWKDIRHKYVETEDDE